jgi:LytS/YehU family sensor histidine kinase
MPVPANFVAGTITDLLCAGLVAATGIEPPGGLTIPRFVGGVFVMGLFYSGWSILYFAIKRTQAARQVKEMLRDMQAMATRAELAMLRYQLNPHFLFNSLASLRQQILEDPKKARDMTGELAGYLRYTLRHSEQTETPLGEELEAIEKYIALEKIRFEDALDVAFEIEPAARDWPVPSFLLQPLVENAFKHGAPALMESPLRLRIGAGVRDGVLHIEVANTGSWLEPADKCGNGGIGLDNLQSRLQRLHPVRHTFEIGPEDGWVFARISLSPAE